MIAFFDSEDFEVDIDKDALIEVIHQIIKDHDLVLKYVNIIFMNDDELLEINKQYLEHDYFTDIITFNYAEDSKELEAELYISLDRVKENAEEYGVPMETELNRVVIHGVLHLAGYEDYNNSLKETMQSFEDKYISMIVPRGTLQK